MKERGAKKAGKTLLSTVWWSQKANKNCTIKDGWQHLNSAELNLARQSEFSHAKCDKMKYKYILLA